MEANQIFFSNASLNNDHTVETMMIALAERLNLTISIANFELPANDEVGAMVVLCNGINMDDRKLLKRLKQLYEANQAIILYEPTNYEVNHVYRYLNDKNYFDADTKGHRHTLFGIKNCPDGICRILESHEKDREAIAESLVQFLTPETEEEIVRECQLRKQAANSLALSNPNLSQVAKQHVITHKFTLAGKSLSLSYYIVAAHKYMGEEANGGEDWFFIQQHGILNSGKDYDCHWAGARQEINDESWYVGDGDVCLNYVDYYMMQNDIKQQNEEESLEADLIYAQPEAINDATSYTISEGVEIGGTIGFEAGSDGGTVAKGSGSFSAGANFSSSYSFNVQDVTCEGTSLSSGTASASWKYTFKRAAQNRTIGKWQHLHEPALLSRSAFSPWNTWVWKFPTSKRDNYKSFTSLFRLSIMNTISRYSGSQSPKHIRSEFKKGDNKVDYTEQSFEVTLASPPLLGVSESNFLLSKEAQSVQLDLIAQGGWRIDMPKDQKWIRINKNTGVGEDKVTISVDELCEGKERMAVFVLIKSQGLNALEEKINIEVVQSAGSV